MSVLGYVYTADMAYLYMSAWTLLLILGKKVYQSLVKGNKQR